MSKSLTGFFVLLFASVFCNAKGLSDSFKTGYNFKKADEVQVLPEILNEISGLTYLDSTAFACIQDENGILFIYDIISNKIKNEFPFNMDGDYEGITRVDNTIYILRSDGMLFEIADYHAAKFMIRSYVTGIPANNNEGICYDARNKRLLIACKGKLGKGPAFKDKRAIYGFDLKTKKLSAGPVYNFDLQELKNKAEATGIAMPQRSKKKGGDTEPIMKLAISAICLHPFTGQLFVLSAADHLLFIFSGEGTVQHIEQLDPDLFNKAEGLTFFENGDMLITNEAQDRKPTLYRFNYRP